MKTQTWTFGVRLHTSNYQMWHQHRSPSEPCLLLSAFYFNLPSSPPPLQNLCSHASNTRAHSSQRDVSAGLHLCLQASARPAACPSSLLFSRQHSSLSTAEPLVCFTQALRCFQSTVGGVIVPPASLVPCLSFFT